MSQAEQSSPKKRGRPATGKRGTFSFRVTDTLRTKLEEAAQQSKRPVSEEIEFRLEQSFRENHLHSVLLGGDRSARLLQYISTALRTAVSADGKNWENDPAIANTVGMSLYYLTLICSASHSEANGMLRYDEELERRVRYAAQLISNQTVMSYQADFDPIGDEKSGVITTPMAIKRFIVDGEKI